MEVRLRAWTLEDAPALAKLINNKKVQDNLRDGLPFPYGEEDAKAFLSAMLASDPDQKHSFPDSRAWLLSWRALLGKGLCHRGSPADL